jgi:hypothetical protein
MIKMSPPTFAPAQFYFKLENKRTNFSGFCMRCGLRMIARLLILVVGSALVLGWGSSCHAEALSLKARYEAAFNAMLAEPANLGRIFEFANLATEYGDLEGAIGAYERLLIFNPDLPRVSYDLGRLYYRIGSYAAAQYYLEEASKGSGIPSEVREDIERYLAAIHSGLSGDRFTGSLSTGFRFQTNANAASTGGIVRVFSNNLVSSEHRRGDLNIFFNADATYIHDFERQGGETFETTASAYGTQQFRVHNLSLAVAELAAGPRIPFRLSDDGTTTFSFRPYLVGDVSALDYVQFFRAYGGGANFQLASASRIRLQLDYRFQHRDFFNTAANPTLSLDTGDIGIAQLNANYAISKADLVGVDAEFTTNEAVAGFERYVEYGAFVTYGHAFGAPFAVSDTIWSAAIHGGRIWRPYHNSDPQIDPNVTRYDRQWTINLSLAAPLNAVWTVTGQVQQDWVRSTLPNFQYTNTTSILAMTYSF